jgi:hypothetical protein
MRLLALVEHVLFGARDVGGGTLDEIRCSTADVGLVEFNRGRLFVGLISCVCALTHP